MLAGVLAAAAAVAAAIVLWPFAPSSRPAAAAVSLPAAVDRGRILVREPDGTLAFADPDGTHVTALNALGVVGQSVSASPDDRYLSEGNGQAIAVGSGPTLTAYRSNVPLASSNGSAWPDSFADHDKDLIMLLNYGEGNGESTYSVQTPVWTATLSSGVQASLGNADAAAGDPQTAGAFVSDAGSPVASASTSQISPDTDVELRVANQPPAVLATAAAINSDLGIVDQPVQLVPVPDPAGDKVAIVVRPVSGSPLGGIVVLTRTGRMLAATPPGATYIAGQPAWSPDGRSLAYANLANAGFTGGNELFIWHMGGQPRPIAIPKAAASQGTAPGGGETLAVPDWCVWSPGGTSVLCSDASQGSQGTWVVASTTARRMTAVHSPGFPVAWLPAGGRT